MKFNVSLLKHYYI